MTIDQEMTIFYIAMFLFFVCPVGLILSAVIIDHRARSNGPTIVHWTNDQPRR
jgi:hypothetical protein